MISMLTSTWGIMAIGGFLGFVVGHGIGYDSCFFDKADTEFSLNNIFDKANGSIDETEFKIRERIRETIKNERPWWCKLI